jgi:hypothetical protein
VTFPDSLIRNESGAFLGNKIEKITLNQGLKFERENTPSFVTYSPCFSNKL